MMRSVLPVTYVITASVLSAFSPIGALILFALDLIEVLFVVAVILIALLLVTLSANIVCSFIHNDDPIGYKKACKILTLGMIPCMVFHFLWSVFLGFLVAVSTILIGLKWYIPVSLIIGIAYMLPGIFYSAGLHIKQRL